MSAGSSQRNLSVTLTLCTKNGGDRLATCLAHIERLDADADMEVFLIDNGSSDGVSFEMLGAFASTSRFDCKVRQTLRVGNSAGRNLAAREAKGDVHIFIDDDCYADPTFVRAWQTLFSNHDIGYGSGMVTRFDPQYSELGCVEYPHERPMAPGQFVPRGLIQGSNMAFRRECLAEAGGFDERLGAGTRYAGEEWDLCLRASRAGWAGGYFPQPKVAHDHRRRDDESDSRMRFYDFGGGVIYAKHAFTRTGIRTLHEYGHEMKVLMRRKQSNRVLVFLRGSLAYLTICWRPARHRA